jgi:hypothetical protein
VQDETRLDLTHGLALQVTGSDSRQPDSDRDDDTHYHGGSRSVWMMPTKSSDETKAITQTR